MGIAFRLVDAKNAPIAMANSHIPKKEGRKHIEAYAAFLALGGRRTYSKLARKLKMSPATIQSWAHTFGWQERVEKADDAVQEKIMEQAMQVNMESKIDFKNLKTKSLKKAYALLEKPGASVKDCNIVWQMAKTELGEPTVISRSGFEGDGKDPFTGLFQMFLLNHAQGIAVKEA